MRHRMADRAYSRSSTMQNCFQGARPLKVYALRVLQRLAEAFAVPIEPINWDAGKILVRSSLR